MNKFKTGETFEEDREPSKDQLRILVDNHRSFKKFLSARVHDEAIAEDLLQQSLKKAVEKPARATENETVLAWFYTILRNALTDHYRNNAVQDRAMTELRETANANTVSVDDLEADVCKCMKGLLPTIKPEYSQLLSRIDLGEESPEDVAQELGISRSNLDVRLHRARQALKKSLVNSCGTCTEHGCLNCTCK